MKGGVHTYLGRRPPAVTARSSIVASDACPRRPLLRPRRSRSVNTRALLGMAPKRSPSLWNHDTLDLRCIRSGSTFWVTGKDSKNKRIHFEVNPRIVDVPAFLLSKVNVSRADANAIVDAIDRDGEHVHLSVFRIEIVALGMAGNGLNFGELTRVEAHALVAGRGANAATGEDVAADARAAGAQRAFDEPHDSPVPQSLRAAARGVRTDSDPCCAPTLVAGPQAEPHFDDDSTGARDRPEVSLACFHTFIRTPFQRSVACGVAPARARARSIRRRSVLVVSYR